MSIRTEPWTEGTPCWVDLTTTDLQSAVAFYRNLFGWEVEDTGEEFGHYGMARVGGHLVCGLGPLPPGQSSPPVWTTYLASNDADKTGEAVTAAGGTLVMAAMDIGSSGRMAMAQDPTGAFFGIWQAGEVIGANLVNEPGGFVWNECRTRDPQRALDFYAAVFGYTYTQMEGGEQYWTINGAGPGNTVGGIGILEADVPAEVPAHWMTYFSVADADATAAACTDGGGQVQLAPFDTPFGRMAVLSDPQGAMFSIAGMMPDTATTEA